MFLLPFLLLAGLVNATIINAVVHWPKDYDPYGCSDEQGFLGQDRVVTLNPDNWNQNYNFYPFQFGGSGTFANTHFVFGLGGDAIYRVLVLDCYCSGDLFLLYNYGVQIGSFFPSTCDTSNTCDYWATDVVSCYDNLQFCRQAYEFGADLYNISVMVVNSAQGFGQGFLVLEPPIAGKAKDPAVQQQT